MILKKNMNILKPILDNKDYYTKKILGLVFNGICAKEKLNYIVIFSPNDSTIHGSLKQNIMI